MAPDEGNALPLLDPDVLDRLRTELEDDEGVWTVFVRNFIDYLPQRTEKLRLTLTTGDLAGAMDAVLSLKTSSQMVGAERLAGLAMDLERSLRHETLDSEPARVLPRLAADHLTQIKRCARQTRYLLQRYLHSKPGGK
ncbi:Hpt domain-containing protein [Pseudarthrobacter raffinosi]|uniref:Hpt domain-containing protein n=1 Tax=Pseudarthrobacter raffinosi TaxID=2953651 RepID=UPI00208E02CF|nr:Hpt domain-containing protein [Pseudarthrobacter sp. MDT3-26]MCO4262565.1 Hpt domain-containing protein [Pseudarthrobacter sp. MDT3-26]